MTRNRGFIVTKETPESWILNHKLSVEAEESGRVKKKIAYVLPDKSKMLDFGEAMKDHGFKWSVCRQILSCDRLQVSLFSACEPFRARGLRFQEFWCDPFYKQIFDDLNFGLLTRSSIVFPNGNIHDL